MTLQQNKRESFITPGWWRSSSSLQAGGGTHAQSPESLACSLALLWLTENSQEHFSSKGKIPHRQVRAWVLSCLLRNKVTGAWMPLSLVRAIKLDFSRDL